MITRRTILGIACVFLSLSPTSNAQQWITTGLVAHYSFNGDTKDQSGNRNDVTTTTAVYSQDRFGDPGRALWFNGTNFHLAFTVLGLPLGNSPRTFSLWYKTAGGFVDPYGAWLFGYGSRASQFNFGEWAMTMAEGSPGWGGLAMGESIVNGQSVAKWKTGVALFVNNTWQHLVVTYDGAEKLLFYLNGVLLPWGNGAFFPPLNTLETYLTIGSSYWQGSWYSGSMDDFRIYNRYMPPTEVSALYAYESTPAVDINKAVYLSTSKLMVGKVYQVQASSDLINWTNQGSPFSATTNAWRSSTYWDVKDWSQLYFRFQKQ